MDVAKGLVAMSIEAVTFFDENKSALHAVNPSNVLPIPLGR